MEEKTTMEITNDRLEEAIKDYAADRTKNFSTIVLHIFLILSWKRVSLWATAYPQISLVEKMPD